MTHAKRAGDGESPVLPVAHKALRSSFFQVDMPTHVNQGGTAGYARPCQR